MHFDEGAFDTANGLAILAGARKPAWETQSDVTGAPELAGDGCDLVGAGSPLYTRIHVPLRASPHRRQGVATIGVFDAASTYTITLGGVAYNAATPANLAAGLAALASAIDGAAGYVASVVGSTVVFYGATDADFTIASSVAAGTGTISIVADPISALLRFWGMPDAASGYSAPTAWTVVRGPTGPGTLALDYAGAGFSVPTEGLARLYVEVDTIAGAGDGGTITYTTPTVKVGPCILENS